MPIDTLLTLSEGREKRLLRDEAIRILLVLSTKFPTADWADSDDTKRSTSFKVGLVCLWHWLDIHLLWKAYKYYMKSTC